MQLIVPSLIQLQVELPVPTPITAIADDRQKYEAEPEQEIVECQDLTRVEQQTSEAEGSRGENRDTEEEEVCLQGISRRQIASVRLEHSQTTRSGSDTTVTSANSESAR